MNKVKTFLIIVVITICINPLLVFNNWNGESCK